MFYQEGCRWFTGYKPCKFKRPCEGCPDHDPVGRRILMISLDAMGAVIRSTCLLPAIRRRYPDAHITWVTYPQSGALLENNPYIDRLIKLDARAIPVLQYLEFDLLYAVDKSLEAGALAEQVKAKEKWGFGLSPRGTIRPFNEAGAYQYQVGLDDDLKFYRNQKPEPQQITETMGLPWVRDPYVLQLTKEEQRVSANRRQDILSVNPEARGIIGYNTGCSVLFPNKKLSVPGSIALIRQWRRDCPLHCIALLGGPEDTKRQEEISAAFRDDPMLVNTPTTGGLRSGILWMDTADMVFSGCSLGMHMAIALGKKVVAWFGVSCSQEIDLYDRGIRLQSDVSCSPCWKRSCDQEVMCYDRVSPARVSEATAKVLSMPENQQLPPERLSDPLSHNHHAGG